MIKTALGIVTPKTIARIFLEDSVRRRDVFSLVSLPVSVPAIIILLKAITFTPPSWLTPERDSLIF